MTFAVVIIIAVYLPILFLEGLEGRMFRPMALTVCTALFGSLLLALTLVPGNRLRRIPSRHFHERRPEGRARLHGPGRPLAMDAPSGGASITGG